MVDINFRTFYKTFMESSRGVDAFMDEVNADIENIFVTHQRKLWDMEKTIDLDAIYVQLLDANIVTETEYTIKRHEDLLLIFNNNYAVKLYSTSVLVPEIIGSRSEWFNDLKYEFINTKPMLNGNVSIADKHIVAKSGLICPNSIDKIFEYLFNDEPVMAIELLLQECE